MDKFTVLKNGLVLTLDRRSQAGYFNIVLKNDKIFLVDYENKFNEKIFRSKNPEAEIIDAKDKLITPGFFNSKLISSYSLNRTFLQKCTYENINSWISLQLIENYFSSVENLETLNAILKINFSRSLLNGELFINECSASLKKDFFDVYLRNTDSIKQYFNLTSYDFDIFGSFDGDENFLSIGFKADENINNYSLSSLKKLLAGSKTKLFIDASLSQKTFESVRKVFGKSFINVMTEMELISGATVFSNPLNFFSNDIEILKKRKANLLLLPSDYINLCERKVNFDELFFSGLNVILGTGYTGSDILSELKLLPLLLTSKIKSYESLLRTVIFNPSVLFGISNLTGSIERNKSADLILFDLSDIRNALTIPDTDSEIICEFLIKYLSARDISDVILKGEIVLKNNEQIFKYSGAETSRAAEISKILYAVGKYLEFKEKYKMRGRVDKLGIDAAGKTENEANSKEEIFVDMTETEEYIGEGEFTIVGTKEEEFEKPRQSSVETEPVVNLKEIKSLEDELNLFEGLEETQQMPDAELSEAKKEEQIETVIEETGSETESEKVVKQEIQTVKLKFGFKDDE